MVAKQFPTVEVECRHCRQKTWHEIVEEEIDNIHERDEEGFISDILEQEYWQILRCCGCRKYAFQRYFCNPHADWDMGGQIWDKEVFPAPGLDAHEARAFHRLPPVVLRAYQEVVKAFNARLYMLAAMGVRMVIEGICKSSGISGKLHEQIDTLRTDGKLTIHQAQILHELRKHGNEAAHEMFLPTVKQMKAYLQVLETTLEVFYEYDALVQSLEAERLQRRADRASG